MEHSLDINYIIGCVIMGMGIGLDVVLATLSRIRSFNTRSTRYTWIFSVTLTHTIFPLIGYFSFLVIYNLSGTLQPVLGVIAFSMIAFFLVDLVKSWLSTKKNESNQSISFALIIAVSLDALWSGPAKSAQAIYWTQLQIYLSFILVAVVVMILTYVALKSGRYLIEKQRLRNSDHESKKIFLMKLFEFLIIGYFGYLALFRYSLGIEEASSAFFASITTTLLVFSKYYKKIRNKNI